VLTNTAGAAAAQTKSARSGGPGRGLGVPGIAGGGLNRNDLVTCFHRWISRYMVYQLHTQAIALIMANTSTAGDLAGVVGMIADDPTTVRRFCVTSVRVNQWPQAVTVKDRFDPLELIIHNPAESDRPDSAARSAVGRSRFRGPRKSALFRSLPGL